MIPALFSTIVSSASGGSTEVTLGYEGISWGWAFLLLLVLGLAIGGSYRWGAAALSVKQRGLLVGLRITLIAVFLFLLIRPVLLFTMNEPVRERLLVLVDTSQSMEIEDQRAAKEDLNRAALAADQLAPDAKIGGTLPRGTEPWRHASRAELLKNLAGNQRLKLWPRLQEKADLEFYHFGSELKKLGEIGAGGPVSVTAAQDFFNGLKFTDQATALGDSLQQALDDNRGQPVAGVLVITDGGNNCGTAPADIANLAKQDGVPLFLYGVGIVSPKDIHVHAVVGPRGSFVKERAEFTVNVLATGYSGQQVKIQLKADGKVVDEKDVKFSADGESEYRLGYEPTQNTEVKIEALITPLEGESSKDNNVATTKLRVLDSHVKVLYVEQEPRWDFRYLLSTLERDRRLAVKSVLFDGGGELAEEPDSRFLKEFPKNREDVVSNEIIIIGDVDPKALGDENMKLINEWVSELGGGLIFLAGPKNNPFRFAGTPLAPLLPVNLNSKLTTGQEAERSSEPFKLKLTDLGESSGLLRMAEEPLENRKIWNSFPGVRWTARVTSARPTAQVLLVDSNPDHATDGQLLPVIAQQNYGQGSVMYFGFDETYRWRSKMGEKYYSKIWNQIILNFSLEHQLGASARTQLKMDRAEYRVGDKVVISGKLFTQGFVPLKEISVLGKLTFTGADGAAKAASNELQLVRIPNQLGSYQMEFKPQAAGQYQFSTLIDPKAILKFTVEPSKFENSQTAMDISLLQAMASASGGKFLREEDLNELPAVISSHRATVPIFKKRELYYSPWWMVVLVTLACSEWLLRRIWQLK